MSQSISEAGFYSYLATPYDSRSEVDLGALSAYTEQVVRAGVDGVTCVASTCDGPYLTETERRRVVETVCKVAAGRVGVNVGVAAMSTRQTIEFARHARDHGATNLMIEMQQYLPISFDAMKRHYADIAAEVELPIRLYNLPSATHVDLQPPMVHALCDAVPSIASVKDASGDTRRLTDIRRLCGNDITLFCGLHFNLLEGMRAGAQGWEVMLHPVFSKAVIDLYRAIKSEPFSVASRTQFMHWSPLFLFFRQYGVPQSVRAISQRTDLPLGPPRRPQGELSDAQKEEVWDLLQYAVSAVTPQSR